jgi:DNA-binding transcriptional regulator YiaG
VAKDDQIGGRGKSRPKDAAEVLAFARIRRRYRERLAAGNARQLRLASGIGTRDFARTLKLRPQTLMAWEKGAREPHDTRKLGAWLDLLDTIERELAAGDDQGGEQLALTGTEGGGRAAP